MTDQQNCKTVSRPVTQKVQGRAEHLADLVAYWESMRRQGDVPRRSEIDPRGIEPLLGNALIAEKIAPGQARLRIAGVHLTDLMGMEVRGMPLSAFFEPEDRPALADALTELFDRPAVIDMVLAAVGRPGRPALSGRLVLLPLRSDLGDISRALGVLISDGQIGAGPRRFGICSQKITPLDLPGGGRLAAGFTEAPAPFAKLAPRHESERPYLRLVK